MKYLIPFLTLISIMQTTQAIEESPYETTLKDGRFEIRFYEPQIVAEVHLEGTLEEAGDQAFRPLFKYITGDNTSKSKIAMTAPVSQEKSGQKIAMTAPVSQEKAGDQWAIGFMMPSTFTMESLPTPTNPSITLREKPAHRIASIRYSGFWSEERYQKHLQKLEEWVAEQGLVKTGQPVWARYNAPFTPWFMRRNEILIPIQPL